MIKHEYAEEIRGFANATSTPVGHIVIINYLYEILTYRMCTTIIAQNTKNQVYLVRFWAKTRSVISNGLVYAHIAGQKPWLFLWRHTKKLHVYGKFYQKWFHPFHYSHHAWSCGHIQWRENWGICCGCEWETCRQSLWQHLGHGEKMIISYPIW